MAQEERFNNIDNDFKDRFNTLEGDVKSIKDEFFKLSEYIKTNSKHERENIEERSRNIYTNAKERAANFIGDIYDEEKATQKYLGDKLHQTSRKLVEETKENPITTIATAAGIGFIIGFFLRK